MAKDIPVDKLKVAVTALNTIIESGKIKMVGAKKSDTVEAFKTKILEFMDADQTDTIPDAAVDFYNEFIADDDGADAGADAGAGTPPPGKGEKKTKTPKEPKPPKEPKAPKEPKPPKEPRGINTVREYSVVQALKKGGTAAELTKIADDIYVENGGSSNLDQSMKLSRKCIKFCEALGILVKTGDKLSIK